MHMGLVKSRVHKLEIDQQWPMQPAQVPSDFPFTNKVPREVRSASPTPASPSKPAFSPPLQNLHLEIVSVAGPYSSVEPAAMRIRPAAGTMQVSPKLRSDAHVKSPEVRKYGASGETRGFFARHHGGSMLAPASAKFSCAPVLPRRIPRVIHQTPHKVFLHQSQACLERQR